MAPTSIPSTVYDGVVTFDGIKWKAWMNVNSSSPAGVVELAANNSVLWLSFHASEDAAAHARDV